jgi:catechol 2,3-dioxygenase-like lactoylglutathione lyase family enzyme
MLMLINTLFHVAIKTRNLDTTQRFYTDVLGMVLDARPAIGFPGIWLRHPLPGGCALFHIYAEDAAREADGSFASGTGVIDHISLTAEGFSGFRDRFSHYGLRWRENVVLDAGLWQLFVYEPSGVLLELTFSAAAERQETPEIPAEKRYKPRENFFHAADYQQFARR